MEHADSGKVYPRHPNHGSFPKDLPARFTLRLRFILSVLRCWLPRKKLPPYYRPRCFSFLLPYSLFDILFRGLLNILSDVGGKETKGIEGFFRLRKIRGSDRFQNCLKLHLSRVI